MRVIVALVILTVACLVVAVPAGSVEAQGADCPSSACPAVPRGAPSYPCLPGQVKGDWSSMLYHVPTLASYAAVGSGFSSDIACFSDEHQALDYGFRPALR